MFCQALCLHRVSGDNTSSHRAKSIVSENKLSGSPEMINLILLLHKETRIEN